jgi:hypothetical protein
VFFALSVCFVALIESLSLLSVHRLDAKNTGGLHRCDWRQALHPRIPAPDKEIAWRRSYAAPAIPDTEDK